MAGREGAYRIAPLSDEWTVFLRCFRQGQYYFDTSDEGSYRWKMVPSTLDEKGGEGVVLSRLLTGERADVITRMGMARFETLRVSVK